MVSNRIINGEGTVFIDREVDEYLGQEASRLILDMKSGDVTPKININSSGGSVFAGYQIIDVILQVSADTHISGIAASIAGVISLHGSHRTANDYSLMMLHKAKGKNSDVVDLVNKRLKNILETKTRLPKEKIDLIFNEDKDLFFDADDMLQFGLIDQIKETGRKKKVVYETTNCNELWEVFNRINQNLDMKNVINKLSLSDTATEQDVLNKIEALEADKNQAIEAENALKEEKENLENELSEIKNKLVEAENSLKDVNKQRASELVKNAISEGKISEKESESWRELANADYAKAENLLGSIQISHETRVVNVSGGNATKDLTLPENRSELIAFMRSNKAIELQEKEPETFKKYQEAYLNDN